MSAPGEKNVLTVGPAQLTIRPAFSRLLGSYYLDVQLLDAEGVALVDWGQLIPHGKALVIDLVLVTLAVDAGA